MLTNLLELHGIKPNEQKVLRYLLEHGSTLASIIAKGTKLKRPNVYAILSLLQSRGFIKKEHREKATYFSALPIKQIVKALEHQAEQEFYDKKQSWKNLEEELEAISTTTPYEFGGFKIETMESMEGVYQWMEEAILSGDFCAIFNPQALQKNQLPTVKNFLKVSASSKNNIREIMVDGPMADWYDSTINNPNHLTKRISAEKKYSSDMILSNGIVALLNYKKENEVAIKIKEPNLYQSMLTLFETLWEKL